MAEAANVSPSTVGGWLRADRRPRRLDELLLVIELIRAEALASDLLIGPVAELLAESRWRASFAAEYRRPAEANRQAAAHARVAAVQEKQEQVARWQGLADRPRPVTEWTAEQLGVHNAINGDAAPARGQDFTLPAYVRRPHDDRLHGYLADLVASKRTALVVIRGTSCTGKTRTAYEAVRAKLSTWNLVFPKSAKNLLAMLTAEVLGPRTVVWLNEAQNLLSDASAEEAAAALRTRLEGDGPALIIATLWTVYHDELTATPAPSAAGRDPHPNARALLAQARLFPLPDAFTPDELATLTTSTDPSLRAVARLPINQVTQILAASPDLVDHYEHASPPHGPYGQALISVAMDAHRLGVTTPLPLTFLEQAAPGYLTDDQRASATSDWLTGALDYARTKVKDVVAALQQVPRSTGMGAEPDLFRLADYLQQHTRATRRLLCPRAAFWDTAACSLPPHHQRTLAEAAERRGRFGHAAALYRSAAEAGDIDALLRLARLREQAGDEDGAEQLARQAADARYLEDLAGQRERAGNPGKAEQLYRDAAAAGSAWALEALARLRTQAGDPAEAERLRQEADQAKDAQMWKIFESTHQEARNRTEAERKRPAASDAERASGLRGWAGVLARAGELDWAEALYRDAGELGNMYALVELGLLREEAGDLTEARRHYARAAKAGSTWALQELSRLCEAGGDHEEAERLARAAADAGDTDALVELARARERAGDQVKAEDLARAAADAGDTEMLVELAELRGEAGDLAKEKDLYQAVVDAGDLSALIVLASLREDEDDEAAAEGLYRAAIDGGVRSALPALARLLQRTGRAEKANDLLRFGMEADGRIADQLYEELEAARQEQILVRSEAAVSGGAAMSTRLESLKGQVDFGVITIREDEFEAVLDRFKPNLHEAGRQRYELGTTAAKNGSEYTFAAVRTADQGQGHAQKSAHDLIHDLQPRWLMVIGIAGAVPSADFTLGDVVCAIRVHDFCVRAVLEGAPDAYSIGGGSMHQQIQQYLANLPAWVRRLGDWNAPASLGLEKPHLEVPGPSSNKYYGGREWRKKVRSVLLQHFPPGLPPRPPLATSRPIATSDALVKSTELLQQWLESARATAAVEMELGGIFLAARQHDREYPILAIRGISDIVGFKREERWTKYACTTAAAFAHALVRSGEAFSPRSS
ncbi:hypothetical protein AB0C27_56020 [Nonomuraea sp. NPDC048882]|uniref:phosphorylase family protein n=1 Tax=Nonomuraea sp. NPDC048882 TaxID=3154347 RepID=UPI0034070D8A